MGFKGRLQNRVMPGPIVAETVGGQIETLTPDLIILLGPGNPRSRESRVWSVSKISRNKHRAMRQNSSLEPPDWDHIVYQHRLRQLSKSAAARFQYRPDTRRHPYTVVPEPQDDSGNVSHRLGTWSGCSTSWRCYDVEPRWGPRSSRRQPGGRSRLGGGPIDIGDEQGLKLLSVIASSTDHSDTYP